MDKQHLLLTIRNIYQAAFDSKQDRSIASHSKMASRKMDSLKSMFTSFVEKFGDDTIEQAHAEFQSALQGLITATNQRSDDAMDSATQYNPEMLADHYITAVDAHVKQGMKDFYDINLMIRTGTAVEIDSVISALNKIKTTGADIQIIETQRNEEKNTSSYLSLAIPSTILVSTWHAIDSLKHDGVKTCYSAYFIPPFVFKNTDNSIEKIKDALSWVREKQDHAISLDPTIAMTAIGYRYVEFNTNADTLSECLKLTIAHVLDTIDLYHRDGKYHINGQMPTIRCYEDEGITVNIINDLALLKASQQD